MSDAWVFLCQSSVADIMEQGDPEETRFQLFDQRNDSLSGNPFSLLDNEDQGASADSDTSSEEDESAFVYDNHHFADLEQRYAPFYYNQFLLTSIKC